MHFMSLIYAVAEITEQCLTDENDVELDVYISPRRAQLIECWPPLTAWNKHTYAKWKIICNI